METVIVTNRTSLRIAQKARSEQVARLAHTLYEKGGKVHGQHLEHWFNAEAMMEVNFGYGDRHREPDLSKEAAIS